MMHGQRNVKLCCGHSCDHHHCVVQQEYSQYTNSCTKIYDTTTWYYIWFSIALLTVMKYQIILYLSCN